MKNSFKRLLVEIDGLCCDDTLTDDALTALSEIFISLQSLSVSCGVGDEYGDRKIYESALDRIFSICRRRCVGSESLLRRSRMAAIMYDIVSRQLSRHNPRQSDDCYRKIYGLLDDTDFLTLSENDFLSEYYICRCVANMFAYVDSAARTSDEHFCRFRRKISEWSADMRPDTDCYEALCRLDIMIRNSDMYSDDTYDVLIDDLRTKYCRSVIDRLKSSENISQRDCLMLVMLYQTMRGTSDVCVLGEISDFAERQFELFPHGSDMRLMCLSVVIDSVCRSVNDHIKREFLARTA